MKKKVLAISALLFGAVLVASGAPACGPGTYDTYIAGGGITCQIGSLVFSNFSFSSSAGVPATAIPATGVTVTPLNLGAEFGFQFGTGMSVASGFQDIIISFVVTGNITDLHASFNGSFSGTGTSSDTETFCKNGISLPPLGSCAVVNQGQYNLTNPPQNLAPAPLVFNPALTSIAISKDINVTAGANGTATISQVTDTFSVPEPMTLSMMGIGLLGLGLMRRRQMGKK